MKKGLLEKVILSGLGLASLTQEKAGKLVDELVREGEVSEKEGAVLAKKVMDNIEKSRKEMENKVDKTVKEIMTKTNIPSKKDLVALEKKIDELSKKLENKKPEAKK
ncbi:MAG: phasin family protein [Candidatus Pacebacteria bacterium]|jgi:poly(hydroxyalkanoate) granule-associated protein|nr:phasin family protein [Candidatus Paceibacterota bacterium]